MRKFMLPAALLALGDLKSDHRVQILRGAPTEEKQALTASWLARFPTKQNAGEFS